MKKTNYEMVFTTRMPNPKFENKVRIKENPTKIEVLAKKYKLWKS